jgi:thiol:disulfide interchange protein
LAIPFLLVAFIPALRTRLPQPGSWMARFQRFLAIPMAATAAGCLWLLWRQGGQSALLVGLVAIALLALLLWFVGLRQRRGSAVGWVAAAGALLITGVAAATVPQNPGASSRVPLGSAVWSEAAVARDLAKGHPVFVYFTADWCLTCKANEAAAIERNSTRDAFEKAGVKVLVGDWTNGDPAITRLLESRGRAGVPLYLWYEPGKAEPEELPQILMPGMLSDRALRSRR